MLKNLKNRIMLLGMSAMGMMSKVAAETEGDDIKIDVNPSKLISDAETAANTDTKLSGLGKVLSVLITVMRYVSAAGIIVSIIMLIWCGIQMASSAGNPQKRAMAMEGIKSTLIAAVIIGAASTIATIAFGLLRH